MLRDNLISVDDNVLCFNMFFSRAFEDDHGNVRNNKPNEFLGEVHEL